ncbi:mechanosensitive ion channel family protein [Ramlibacter rhizophilus]|uniref:Small-conductance mechanosensitive channel n=1 Tax=Ramlibacter rhizophilus TaxID=1781167 RepID=A0A4Z0BS96_9BURK|nr:mechanosensitive ion channel family protein [Ramlibacter rhizophilus]TFZ01334.1 mechanosensitive ion channel family protein [Ramlibacter rhizophilus]
MNFALSDATAAVQQMLNGFIDRLPYIVVALVVFLFFYAVGRGVRAALRAFALRRHKRQNLALVLGRLGYGVILFIGLLISLVIAIPGFTPGQLISLLGLSSVAIGFAFRDILQNFLAGILLLLNEPFRIGDQIVINDFEGTVDEIQMRATFLNTYDGRRVVIPNSNLFTNSVIVNTANEKRRLEYDVGIGYGDDIANAKEVMLRTLGSLDEVLPEPPPEALVVGLADSTVNIRLRWWVEPPRQWDKLQSQDAVLQRVAGALHEAGIDLPFPTQQVLFHDQTEDSDGDRRRQREGWPARPGDSPRPARIADGLGELARSSAQRGERRPDT